MSQTTKTDIAVIGAGSGGLSVAAGAVQMGAKVVLIERAKMGGDCLNYGCVPSKALLAAAHAAHNARSAGTFGVYSENLSVDFEAVHRHVHEVIAAIEPNDSVERYRALGVEVIQSEARFVSDHIIEAGERLIEAKRIVIATGSSASIPPIPGLESTPFLSNETIFDLKRCPTHLIIVGGGPIGMEMAQAHRRLGAAVTVLDGLCILGKDDPEAVEIIRQQILNEGITLHENSKVTAVSAQGDGVRVEVETVNGEKLRIDGTDLLIAVGRSPNISSLNLENAGIEYDRKGIKVDRRLRTSNSKVYAIGDVASAYQFTHMAGYQAGIAIRNILFRLPAKARTNTIPWVTYTDPELAHAGMLETEACQKYGTSVQVLRWHFAENDRATAERATQGMVKVILGRRGRILGATLVGKHAGELLAPWVIAMENRLKIGAMANTIMAYPTLSEVSKRAAGSFYTPTLYGDRIRCLVRLLLRLP